MPMTCVTAGCTKPCHEEGDRFCADHMIAYLRGSLNRAHHEAVQGLTLSLRDRFATASLQGLRANPHAWEEMNRAEMVEAAWADADAMLAARNEGAQ